MMAEDWGECCNSDVEMREATSKAKISDRISNAIITFHVFAVLSYGVGIIAIDVDVTDHTNEILHINKIELPFDIRTQRIYRLVLITELMHILLCAVAISILNALLITLVSARVCERINANDGTRKSGVKSVNLETDLENLSVCNSWDVLNASE